MRHLISPCKNGDGVNAIKYSLITLLFFIAAMGAIVSSGEMLFTFLQNIAPMTVVVSG